jgi:hypothetical protein
MHYLDLPHRRPEFSSSNLLPAIRSCVEHFIMLLRGAAIHYLILRYFSKLFVIMKRCLSRNVRNNYLAVQPATSQKDKTELFGQFTASRWPCRIRNMCTSYSSYNFLQLQLCSLQRASTDKRRVNNSTFFCHRSEFFVLLEKRVV